MQNEISEFSSSQEKIQLKSYIKNLLIQKVILSSPKKKIEVYLANVITFNVRKKVFFLDDVKENT